MTENRKNRHKNRKTKMKKKKKTEIKMTKTESASALRALLIPAPVSNKAGGPGTRRGVLL